MDQKSGTRARETLPVHIQQPGIHQRHRNPDHVEGEPRIISADTIGDFNLCVIPAGNSCLPEVFQEVPECGGNIFNPALTGKNKPAGGKDRGNGFRL